MATVPLPMNQPPRRRGGIPAVRRGGIQQRPYSDILAASAGQSRSGLGPVAAAPAAAPATAMPAVASVGAPAAPARPRATGPYSDVINAYTDAQDRANTANETRYQGILSTLEGQGNTAKADIARGGAAERGEITQDAIGRGLYSTSVLDTLRGGSREREARQSAAVDEAVAAQRAGVMERRTDQGPDAGFYSSLLQQRAAADGQNQRGTQTIGAMSGGGGFPGMGMDGGGGGSERQDQQGQRRGGGGGSGGMAGGTYSASGGGGGVSGYSGGGVSTVNPDGTARFDPRMVPRGGANIFLGERGSVTSPDRKPPNANSRVDVYGTGNLNMWDKAFWEARGYKGVEAVEMASRYANRRPK